MDAGRRIVLIHEDVPLAAGSNARRTYLEILRDAVRDGNGRFVVVFPAGAEADFAAALDV